MFTTDENAEGQDDLTARLIGSSVMAVCQRCGSTATYRGSPEKINEAVSVFYDLHERCWKRNQKESR